MVAPAIGADVDELGHILREAREARGLSLEDGFAATRITKKFLQALEEGRYERLPTPVHVRGYLRNYARFLGLDPEPLVERYNRWQEQRPAAPAPSRAPDPVATPDRPLPVRDDQPFFEPVNMELDRPLAGARDSSGLVRLVIIVAFLAMIGLATARFLPLAFGGDDGMVAIEAALINILATETPATDPAALAGPALVVTGEPAVDTSRNTGAFVDVAPEALNAAGATVTAQAIQIDVPTPTPTRPALPAVLDTIRLRIDVAERTWLRITVDGEVQFQGQAVRNDFFEYEARQQVTVDAGNAIAVLVTINDVELGRLGSRGENHSETWSTTSGG